MSKADVLPGATETQALKIVAPPGVSGSIAPAQKWGCLQWGFSLMFVYG
jgi:hypothetical protein